MAVYNTEKFLTQAIESILQQTFADFEFLIIDDGSKDQSRSIIQQYAQKDMRIKAFKNKENKGISYTRNKLMEKAQAEYIAVMDSDDISEFNRLELEYHFLEKHPEYAVVSGHNLIINEKGEEIWIRYYNNPIEKILLKKNPISQGSSLFRKSVYDLVWGYNSELNYGEDYDLWLKIYAHGYKIYNIDEVLCKIRIRSGQTKSSQLKATIKNTIAIQKKAISTYQIPAKPSDWIYIGLEYCLLLLPSHFILRIFKKLTYTKKHIIPQKKTFKILDFASNEEIRQNSFFWVYLSKILGYREISDGIPEYILYGFFWKKHQKSEYKSCKKIFICAENLFYPRYYRISSIINSLKIFKIPKKRLNTLQSILWEKILNLKLYKRSINEYHIQQLNNKQAFWILSNSGIKNSLNFPYFLYAYREWFLDIRNQKKHQRKELSPEEFKRKKFCAFIVSNWENEERIKLFKDLSKYKQVDSFWSVYHNRDFPNQWNYFQQAYEIYNEYKFVICFENSHKEGYITEKLTNVFLSSALPIYQAREETYTYFTPNTFINSNNFASQKELIAHIIHLDQNLQAYNEYFKQSPINEENISSKYKELFEFYHTFF